MRLTGAVPWARAHTKEVFEPAESTRSWQRSCSNENI